MEIKGKIKFVSDPQEGETEKGKWAKRTIVIVEDVAEHPNEIVLSLFKNGENIQYATDKFTYQIGDIVRVEYNTRANEYKGKWYGDNSIWRIEKAEAPNVEMREAQEQTDDLPF
jgi:hypothetical protein